MDTVEAVNTHCKKVNKFSYGDMPQGGASDAHPRRDAGVVVEVIDN